LTPVEIFEYKQRWKPGYSVRLHSDVVDKGKAFAKRNCQKHQWSVTTWTNVYEHTFHFEYEESARKFKIAMGEFADQ
jgi:hypothetical protein